ARDRRGLVPLHGRRRRAPAAPGRDRRGVPRLPPHRRSHRRVPERAHQHAARRAQGAGETSARARGARARRRNPGGGTMKDQLDERLKSLQPEYGAGQKMLAELDARRTALTTTLLRIEGAIQVLKEMSAPPADDAAAAPAAPPALRSA